ncbi:MAG: hypothetical protein KatS3mg028_0691 [Bacteroidia bacterium]|nr:MAG: hypothetical protein KatS3mg028_0691 [Bacteroidia bacterium]
MDINKTSIHRGKTIAKCEAKPKNLDTEEFERYKRGERKTKPAKLNGGGNFTDYTASRLEKDWQGAKPENVSKRIYRWKIDLHY